MKYFADLQVTYIPKNKAHEEIQEFARSKDGTLINSEQARQKFKAEFDQKLAEINLKYKKCHDLQWSGYNPDDMLILIDGNFRIKFLIVYHELS